MSTAHIEGLPLGTFDRWFPFFEIIPALVVLTIVLVLGNVLLGFNLSAKKRITANLIDIGCAAFALFLGRHDLSRLSEYFTPVGFVFIYAAYYLKRRTYPNVSRGRPALLALGDFSILLIALAFWVFVRTTLFCMCL